MTEIVPAPYAPFLDPRTARAPGLSPLEPASWTVVHADFAGQMARREALLADRRDVVIGQTEDGTAPAGELLADLLDHLGRMAGYSVGAEAVTRPDGADVPLDRADPLDTIGRLVAEDFCLLVPDRTVGEYRLVAAVLCFPSRWLLSEKLGRPLTIIHDPVPEYDAELARRVNRVFEALRVGRPLCRVNWLVHPTGELHLPAGADAKEDVTPDAQGRLFLRTERQTLTRLPVTGAVAFGIKTSVTPLRALSPEIAAGLAAALGGVAETSIAYRAGGGFKAEALAQLRETALQERARGTCMAPEAST